MITHASLGRYSGVAPRICTRALLVVSLTVLLLAALPSDAGVPSMGSAAHASADVPKAQCGPGDRPESVLQGQVPFNERAAGFKGYNCNLDLTPF